MEQTSAQLKEELQGKEKEHESALQNLKEQVKRAPWGRASGAFPPLPTFPGRRLARMLMHAANFPSLQRWTDFLFRRRLERRLRSAPRPLTLLLSLSSLHCPFFVPPPVISYFLVASCLNAAAAAGKQTECSQSGEGGQHPAGE